MPEMHLRQPSITYSACGSCTKNNEKIPRFKDSRDIFRFNSRFKIYLSKQTRQSLHSARYGLCWF